ncbi:MAG: DUF5050 domain-containing protein [Oscillospiraceae bacterium]|nr:DUF5050 domain-containing protein [Oscillospiraceae bacterium]
MKNTIVLIIISLILLSGCRGSIDPNARGNTGLDYIKDDLEEIYPNARGNTNSNTVNGGWVVESDGWIYFAMSGNWTNASPEHIGIYKMRANGSEKTQIIKNENALFLNIAGEYIYYTSHIMSEDDRFEDQVGFYRVNLDGSEKTKLSNDFLVNTIIIGSWIYYNGYNEDEKTHNITKMRLNGSEKTTLFELKPQTPIWNINIEGDWIYFIKDWKDGIFKIKTDGSILTPLFESNYNQLQVVDEKMYIVSNFNVFSHMTITDLDGNIISELDQDKEQGWSGEWNGKAIWGTIEPYNFDFRTYITDGEWFYFSGFDESPTYGSTVHKDGPGFYKIRTDGTELTKLSDMFAFERSINLAGDWIFFFDLFEPDKAYMMKKDGTELQPLLDYGID